MSITAEKTVRELALENPAATRVFEELSIDYCCGGHRTLDEACTSAQVSIERVVLALDVVPAERKANNWGVEPLSELISHIKNLHHRYTRDEIKRLGPLFDKVCSVHGANHQRLRYLRETFSELAQELTMHMLKEEAVLWLSKWNNCRINWGRGGRTRMRPDPQMRGASDLKCGSCVISGKSGYFNIN